MQMHHVCVVQRRALSHLHGLLYFNEVGEAALVIQRSLGHHDALASIVEVGCFTTLHHHQVLIVLLLVHSDGSLLLVVLLGHFD